MTRRALAVLAAAALLIAPGAGAAEPVASLPDLEDEVMCTICGTTLGLANAPQAEQERDLIRELIAQGKTKEEVKDALVAEYGPEVLAVPSTEGFDLAAWIVPIAGIALAAALIAIAVTRWRRAAPRPNAGTPPGGEPDAAAEGRLAEDMRRYDS